jgi:hypothetical protein
MEMAGGLLSVLGFLIAFKVAKSILGAILYKPVDYDDMSNFW